MKAGYSVSFGERDAIVRRARSKAGVTAADKGHLHHRLMDLGHGQRRSVVILWTWTALLSGLVLYPLYADGSGNALVPAGVAALAVLLYTVLHPEARRSRSAAAEQLELDLEARSNGNGVEPEPVGKGSRRGH